jgi:CubicO group peptidase (beta-lactamase class C family)
MRLLASTLLALVATTPTTWTQTLDIRPAVELVVHSPVQTAYSLESSRDLQTWQPLRSATLGNGQPTQILVAASDVDSTAAFFRIATNRVRDLNSLLEPIRAANRVPAVACAVVLSNRVVGIGAVGLRKAGVPSAPVTLEDKWHHGSLTKSMTATLAAILVREGRIQWSTTLADVFPDWAPKMNAGWRTATLEQLTSNRGGAPGDLNASGIWSLLWNFVGTPRESRRLLLEKLTVLPPQAPPGTRYEYSNAGFALAGHMLESVLNRPWEELMTDRLFEPLGMSSAGFGVPAAPRYINQPWGHQWINGNPVPVEPGTSADNPPGIGPAGTVHCTVLDLAKYAAFHTHGHLHDQPLLPTSTLVKLHTAYPDNSNYAHGWIETQRGWANPGKAYTHSGSNLQWFSVIWFAPARQFAAVALCNVATSASPNPGNVTADQIVGKMIQEFLP